MSTDVVGPTDGPWSMLAEVDTDAGPRYGIWAPDPDAPESGDEVVVGTIRRLEDARLVVASPKMLAALKQCAAVLSGEAMTKERLIAALEATREALSTATGATPDIDTGAA